MSDSQRLEAGCLITENVRLVRLLGEGGMGSVWIADHLTLHTQVAVKFMSSELVQNASAVARFTREATAAAQVKSPHIVQTYDHGVTAEGLPYIVMELLEGEDLGRRVERTGRLSLADTSTIITQTCKVLGRAHALGIVHRDIKPDNIFLLATDDAELFVKVLDFGVAKASSGDPRFGMTTTGAMVGTPYYMSPEQLRNSKDVDLRADLWSLVVVAYYCLTGTVPFDAESFADLCITIDKGVFRKPSEFVEGLPHELDAFFEVGLARDFGKRFATSRDLAEALASVAGRQTAGRETRPDAEVPAKSVAFAGTLAATPESIGSPNKGSAEPAPTRRSAGIGIAIAVAVVAVAATAALVLLSREKTSGSPQPAVGTPIPDSAVLRAPEVLSASAAPVVAAPPTSASAEAQTPVASSAAPGGSAPVAPTKSGKGRPTKGPTPPTKGNTEEPDRGF